MAALLKVKNLKTEFQTDHGLVRAVDGVDYHVDQNEIIAIVGESGCGKSVSQMSVLQLIPSPPGKITSGEVYFKDRNLLDYRPNSDELRSVRGGKIAMIFQEPMTSLNPVLTIKRQLTEIMELHLNCTRKQALQRALELLDLVGIPEASKRVNNYPHQFSGGMRQRVMIAMAISCNPKIIIADEPTTALDVTTQAQLLDLLKQIISKFKSSLILVTHDLGIVARYAQRIYVMYAGRIVETGTTKEIFGEPAHPYTKALIKCVPRLDDDDRVKLLTISGMPPNLINLPPICAFFPRCPYRMDVCGRKPWPELKIIQAGHSVACYLKA